MILSCSIPKVLARTITAFLCLYLLPYMLCFCASSSYVVFVLSALLPRLLARIASSCLVSPCVYWCIMYVYGTSVCFCLPRSWFLFLVGLVLSWSGCQSVGLFLCVLSAFFVLASVRSVWVWLVLQGFSVLRSHCSVSSGRQLGFLRSTCCLSSRLVVSVLRLFVLFDAGILFLHPFTTVSSPVSSIVYTYYVLLLLYYVLRARRLRSLHRLSVSCSCCSLALVSSSSSVCLTVRLFLSLCLLVPLLT